LPAVPLAGLLVLAMGLFACGGGDTGGPGGGAVASVRIAPDGLTLPVGGTGGLSADVRDVDDVALADTQVTWSSLNGLVASVGQGGTVAGVSSGITQVIAAAGEKADTVAVIVVDQLMLEVVPGAAAAQIGGTAQFTVIARNGSGQVIATPAVSRASGRPAVGTILPSGLAAGLSLGQTLITASAGSAASLPAVLIVSAAGALCDGIEAVPEWRVSLAYSIPPAAPMGTTT
jgi:hypothetical protein